MARMRVVLPPPFAPRMAAPAGGHGEVDAEQRLELLVAGGEAARFE